MARRRFLQRALGAVLSPAFVAAASQNREKYSVHEFGARGDGGSNDRSALRRALERVGASGGTLYFPEGTYDLGNCSGESILPLLNASDVTLSGYGARLVCRSTEKVISRVFDIVACSGITIEGFSVEDSGMDINALWKGANCITLSSSQTAPTRDVRIVDVRCKTVLGAAVVAAPGPRVSGIRVQNMTVIDSYYGINCQNNGDGLRAVNVLCRNTRRSYFVYGCRDHQAEVISQDNKTGSNDVIIHSNLRDTEDIELSFRCRGKTHGEAIVQLSHERPEGGRAIRNVRLDLDVEVAARPLPYGVVFFHRNQGKKELESTTANRWTGISIRGRMVVGDGTVPIAAASRQTEPGVLVLDKGLITKPANLALQGFRVARK